MKLSELEALMKDGQKLEIDLIYLLSNELPVTDSTRRYVKTYLETLRYWTAEAKKMKEWHREILLYKGSIIRTLSEQLGKR